MDKFKVGYVYFVEWKVNSTCIAHDIFIVKDIRGTVIFQIHLATTSPYESDTFLINCIYSDKCVQIEESEIELYKNLYF